MSKHLKDYEQLANSILDSLSHKDLDTALIELKLLRKSLTKLIKELKK